MWATVKRDRQTGVTTPVSSYENVLVALEWGDFSFYYDLFRHRCMTDDRRLLTNGKPIQELSDAMELQLREMIFDQHSFSVGPMHMHDGVQRHAYKNPRHPLLESIESSKWNGQSLITTAFHRHLQTEDTPYSQALSRLFFIAAIRRLRNPGCKFDHFIIFEGPQGLGKSEAIRAIAGDAYYSDVSLFRYHDHKQQMENMEGVWINEFADLAQHNRRDIDEVKSFLTRREDRSRMAYGRNSESRDRSIVFVGTTNKSKYLKDLTGNRRFNPIQCFSYENSPYLNIKAIEAEREQLWAEAAHYEALGESIQLSNDLIPVAEIYQTARTEEDPWVLKLNRFEDDDPVDKVTGKPIIDKHPIKGTNRVELRVAKTDVITVVIGKPVERQLQGDMSRLDHSMREEGWVYGVYWIFTRSRRGYSKEVIAQPEQQAAPQPDPDDETPF